MQSIAHQSTRQTNDRITQDAHLIAVSQATEKQIKQKGRVGRTGRRLGVKLHREEGFVRVNDALVRPVVGVDEEGLPVGGQRQRIDSKTLRLG